MGTRRIHDPNDTPREVEYDLRPIDSFVISGPIYPARGPGRTFFTPEHALKWAETLHPGRVQLLVPPREDATRWAILVRRASKT